MPGTDGNDLLLGQPVTEEARPISRRDAACRVSRRAQRRRSNLLSYQGRVLAPCAKAVIGEQQVLGTNQRLVFGENHSAFDRGL